MSTPLGGELGDHQAELAKLELAQRNLETHMAVPGARRRQPGHGRRRRRRPDRDVQMRIVEAQEAERSRLAQEVHDGRPRPCRTRSSRSSTSSASSTATRASRATELRFLRDLLRRELGDVRTFISQLRPPVLDELGLDGAIEDAVDHMRPLTGLAITTELDGAADAPRPTAQQTVVLRVAQEALQNVRKHARRDHRHRRARAIDDDGWVLEVRDDGRGFDVGAVGRSWPPQLRSAIHARASRADRRPLRSTITTGRRHRRPAGDPDRTPTGAEEST